MALYNTLTTPEVTRDRPIASLRGDELDLRIIFGKNFMSYWTQLKIIFPYGEHK